MSWFRKETTRDPVIIKQVDKLNFVIQCAFCRGKGLEPYRTKNWNIAEYDKSEACTLCNGRGVIKVVVVDELIPDLRCHGTGLKYDSDTSRILKCPTCDGFGVRSLSGDLKYYK